MIDVDVNDREETTRLFQDRIFRYLEHKKISNVEFANAIGVSKQHVSKWKNHKTMMNTATQIKVLTVYNEINLHWLMTGVGPMEVLPDHQRLKEIYETLDEAMTKLNMEIKELKEQREINMMVIKRYESERIMLWEFIEDKTGLKQGDITLNEKKKP